MADNNDSRNRTTFEAEGVSKTSQAFFEIANAAGKLQGVLGSFARVAAPVTAALGAIGGAISARKILEVSGAYENVQARLAGTLTALDFGKDFTEGLQNATSVMDSLYASAARLPGEAEDYIEIFTQGLPVVSQAIKGGLEEFTAYTNKYTAIAKSLQVDTWQASSDLQRMLAPGRGIAGLESRTYQRLLPYMKQVQGYANLTTQSFNALSQTARADLIGKVMAKLTPMIDHMSNSWEAVRGAAATAGRDLIRIGGQNVFAHMKSAVNDLANGILDANGRLTAFGSIVARVGQTVGEKIGGALDRAVAQAKALAETLPEAIRRMAESPWARRLDQLFARMRTSARDMGVGGPSSTTAKVMGAGAGALAGGALATLLPGGPLIAMLLSPITAALGASLGPMIGGFFTRFGFDRMAQQAAAALHSLWAAAQPIVSAFVKVADVLFDVSGSFQGLKVDLAFAGDQLLELFKGLMAVIGPVMEIVGPALVSAFHDLTIAALSLVGAFGKLLQWIGDKLGLAAQVLGFSSGTKGHRGMETPEKPGAFSTWLSSLLLPAQQAAKAIADTGTARKRPVPQGNVIQDFRGSRFTIQQDFAENFDPDRVAVAFASDVERIGRQRLQSGFEPLFGVS